MNGRGLIGLAWVTCFVVAATGCKKARSRTDDMQNDKIADPATAVPGVTEDRITFGTTAVFRGPEAEKGTEYWRGAQAYLREVNANGGVNGRQIDVVARDDGYQSAVAIENVKKLVESDRVFALFNVVGSQVVADLIPELAKFPEPRPFIWGNYSGGKAQRAADGIANVFSVRASSAAEVKQLVEALHASGRARFGAYAQDDAFGKSGVSGVKAELQAEGLTLTKEFWHPRGVKFEDSAMDAVKQMRAAGVDAVICVTNYQPAAAFIRDARNDGWSAPIANVAGAADTMLRHLVAYEKKSNKVVTSGLINSSVVPSYEDVALPAVAEYRALMERRNPHLPSELEDPNYRSLPFGFSSLEGFLNAKVMVEVLRRAGPKLTRESFRSSAEQLRDWDPGVGASVTLASSDHQAFDKVWLIAPKNGHWAPVGDGKVALNDKPEKAEKAEKEKMPGPKPAAPK